MESNRVEAFLEYKNLLFSLAYNMLGVVEDAEDMVQETYIKWMKTPVEEIKYPKAFLSKIVTNLSINYLNSAKKQRESYIGLWLPEPLVKEKFIEEFKSYDLYYSLSIGMMVLLEKLTASERAVFLLKEIFNYEYSEIAEIISKTEDNCRQIFVRAKKNLGGSEKRFQVDLIAHEKILNSFISALGKGDINELIGLLQEDIQLLADGGGKTFRFGKQKFSATRNPIMGIKNVCSFIVNIVEKVNKNIPDLSRKIIMVNGLPSLVTYSAGKAYSVFSFEVIDDKIANIYIHSNPDKIKNF